MNKWRSQRSLPQGGNQGTEFFNSAHNPSSIRGPYGGICFYYYYYYYYYY